LKILEDVVLLVNAFFLKSYDMLNLVSGYGYMMAMGGTNGSQGMLSSCEQVLS
jgi:hypothetical protein